MGIDIGSGTSKGIVRQNGRTVTSHSLLTGVNYRLAAEKLKDILLKQAKLSIGNIACIVATGQGGTTVDYANRQATDIICCARGINNVFPDVRTVIDVEGQSTQVIRINDRGRVINFVISEKCAAGAGRFLEIISNVLQIPLSELGPLSLKSTHPIVFTTACAVFGESEAVSRVAEGIPKEDIVAGIHRALAEKIASLVSRAGLEEKCAICGGSALNTGLVNWVKRTLKIELRVPPQPQFITALGAAIIAEDLTK